MSITPPISAEIAGGNVIELPFSYLAPSVYGSPRPPTPDAHRFYLCQPSKDRNGSMVCQKGAKEEVERAAADVLPSSVIVTIHAKCPEIVEQLVLSSKLSKPVAMGRRLS
jgi:hypothetical protein